MTVPPPLPWSLDPDDRDPYRPPSGLSGMFFGGGVGGVVGNQWSDDFASARSTYDTAADVARATGVPVEPEPGLLTSALGALDRFVSAGAGFTTGLLGADLTDEKGRLTDEAGFLDVRAAFDRARRGAGGEHIGWGDTAALRYDEDDSGLTKFVKGAAAFTGDVLSDPLTYVSFGTSIGRGAAAQVAAGQLVSEIGEEALEAAGRRAAGRAAEGLSREALVSEGKRALVSELDNKTILGALAENRGTRAFDVDSLAAYGIDLDAAMKGDLDTRKLVNLLPEEELDRVIVAAEDSLGPRMTQIAGEAQGNLNEPGNIGMSLTKLAATTLGEGAYRLGGARRLREELRRVFGEEMGDNLFSKMHSDVRGGARLRIPGVRSSVNEKGAGFRPFSTDPRAAIPLFPGQTGGGQIIDSSVGKALGFDKIVDGTEGIRRWVQSKEFAQKAAKALGGRYGGLAVRIMADIMDESAAATDDPSAFSRLVTQRVADEGRERARRIFTEKYERLIRNVPDAWRADPDVQAAVSRLATAKDIDAVAAAEGHDAEVVDFARNLREFYREWGSELALLGLIPNAQRTNYIPHLVKDEYLDKVREFRVSTRNPSQTHVSSGHGSTKARMFDDFWADEERAEWLAAQGLDVFDLEDPVAFNRAIAEYTNGEITDVFVEDPFEVLIEYQRRMLGFVSEHQYRELMKRLGIVYADDAFDFGGKFPFEGPEPSEGDRFGGRQIGPMEAAGLVPPQRHLAGREQPQMPGGWDPELDRPRPDPNWDPVDPEDVRRFGLGLPEPTTAGIPDRSEVSVHRFVDNLNLEPNPGMGVLSGPQWSRTWKSWRERVEGRPGMTDLLRARLAAAKTKVTVAEPMPPETVAKIKQAEAVLGMLRDARAEVQTAARVKPGVSLEDARLAVNQALEALGEAPVAAADEITDDVIAEVVEETVEEAVTQTADDIVDSLLGDLAADPHVKLQGGWIVKNARSGKDIPDGFMARWIDRLGEQGVDEDTARSVTDELVRRARGEAGADTLPEGTTPPLMSDQPLSSVKEFTQPELPTVRRRSPDEPLPAVPGAAAVVEDADHAVRQEIVGALDRLVDGRAPEQYQELATHLRLMQSQGAQPWSEAIRESWLRSWRQTTGAGEDATAEARRMLAEVMGDTPTAAPAAKAAPAEKPPPQKFVRNENGEYVEETLGVAIRKDDNGSWYVLDNRAPGSDSLMFGPTLKSMKRWVVENADDLYTREVSEEAVDYAKRGGFQRFMADENPLHDSRLQKHHPSVKTETDLLNEAINRLQNRWEEMLAADTRMSQQVLTEAGLWDDFLKAKHAVGKYGSDRTIAKDLAGFAKAEDRTSHRKFIFQQLNDADEFLARVRDLPEPDIAGMVDLSGPTIRTDGTPLFVPDADAEYLPARRPATPNMDYPEGVGIIEVGNVDPVSTFPYRQRRMSAAEFVNDKYKSGKPRLLRGIRIAGTDHVPDGRWTTDGYHLVRVPEPDEAPNAASRNRLRKLHDHLDQYEGVGLVKRMLDDARVHYDDSHEALLVRVAEGDANAYDLARALHIDFKAAERVVGGAQGKTPPIERLIPETLGPEVTPQVMHRRSAQAEADHHERMLKTKSGVPAPTPGPQVVFTDADDALVHSVAADVMRRIEEIAEALAGSPEAVRGRLRWFAHPTAKPDPKGMVDRPIIATFDDEVIGLVMPQRTDGRKALEQANAIATGKNPPIAGAADITPEAAARAVAQEAVSILEVAEREVADQIDGLLEQARKVRREGSPTKAKTPPTYTGPDVQAFLEARRARRRRQPGIEPYDYKGQNFGPPVDRPPPRAEADPDLLPVPSTVDPDLLPVPYSEPDEVWEYLYDEVLYGFFEHEGHPWEQMAAETADQTRERAAREAIEDAVILMSEEAPSEFYTGHLRTPAEYDKRKPRRRGKTHYRDRTRWEQIAHEAGFDPQNATVGSGKDAKPAPQLRDSVVWHGVLMDDFTRDALRMFGKDGQWQTFLSGVFEPYMRWFRTQATVGRGPGFVIRNLIGGLSNARLTGATHRDMLDGLSVANMWRKANSEVSPKGSGKRLFGRDLMERRSQVFEGMVRDKYGDRADELLEAHRQFLKMGLADIRQMSLSELTGFTGASQLFDRKRREDLNVAEALLEKTARIPFVTEPTANATKQVEHALRFGAFMAGVRRYGLKDGGYAASMLTKASQFDYADLSPFERNVMREFIPFYTFARKNLPLQVRGLLRDPAKFAHLQRLVETVQEAYVPEEGSQEEAYNDVLPEWFRENLGAVTGLGLGGGALGIRAESPKVALEEWLPGSPRSLRGAAGRVRDTAVSQANPLLDFAFAAATGRDSYTGQPIEDGTGSANMWDYFGRQLSPAYSNVMRTMPVPWATERDESRRAGAWLSSIGGAPLATIDERSARGALRARAAELNQQTEARLEAMAEALGLEERELRRLIREYGPDGAEDVLGIPSGTLMTQP